MTGKDNSQWNAYAKNIYLMSGKDNSQWKAYAKNIYLVGGKDTETREKHQSKLKQETHNYRLASCNLDIVSGRL